MELVLVAAVAGPGPAYTDVVDRRDRTVDLPTGGRRRRNQRKEAEKDGKEDEASISMMYFSKFGMSIIANS